LLDEVNSSSPDLHESLQIIRRNVQLEARLIDDLLDLARIRNGKLKLQLQPTEAHEVLRHALDICQPSIAARGLQVDLHLRAQNTIIQADPARLQQVFWNLISNAVKFTPEGGKITIATGNDENGQSLKVEISDTGVGVDPSKLARIFDAFEQAAQRNPAGLGLGLAICKALTEFHGGAIAAQSGGIGRGSTFSVTFSTANLLVADSIAPKPAPVLESVPLRLLVVEDHHDTAATLRRLLVRRGYEVECADSFTAAVEKARSYDFDVLVTDIGLPDGNGVDLFRWVKQQNGTERVRGVALSGFGTDEDLARSEAAGFSEHLTKPVDFAHLQQSLARIGKEMHTDSDAGKPMECV
jgi:CheY-like chemotaxis protein